MKFNAQISFQKYKRFLLQCPKVNYHVLRQKKLSDTKFKLQDERKMKNANSKAATATQL